MFSCLYTIVLCRGVLGCPLLVDRDARPRSTKGTAKVSHFEMGGARA